MHRRSVQYLRLRQLSRLPIQLLIPSDQWSRQSFYLFRLSFWLSRLSFYLPTLFGGLNRMFSCPISPCNHLEPFHMYGFFKQYCSSGMIRYHSCSSIGCVHIHGVLIRYPWKNCTFCQCLQADAILKKKFRSSKQIGNWMPGLGRANLLLIQF